MEIFEKIKKKLLKTSSSTQNSHYDERIAAEKRLSEYLSEERNRQKLLEEKLYEESLEKNREQDRIASEERLTEYLAEERERRKVLEEKLYEDVQSKKRIEKEQIKQSKFDAKNIKKSIRREQSRAQPKNTKNSEKLGSLAHTEVEEVSLCTCETTPDNQKIKCGFCMKIMCQSCWDKHRFSHGRTESISITYRSDGKMTGKL